MRLKAMRWKRLVSKIADYHGLAAVERDNGDFSWHWVDLVRPSDAKPRSGDPVGRRTIFVMSSAGVGDPKKRWRNFVESYLGDMLSKNTSTSSYRTERRCVRASTPEELELKLSVAV